MYKIVISLNTLAHLGKAYPLKENKRQKAVSLLPFLLWVDCNNTVF